MKIIDVEQNTPQWWEARKGLATASKFQTILPPSKLKAGAGARTYICELIAERMMVGPPEWLQENNVETRHMANGKAREDDARDLYAMMTCKPIQRVGFVTTDCGRFGCSPDSLVGDDGGLEIKCPKLVTQIGYLLDNDLPSEYIGQCHGGMIVCERKWFDFVSYHPGLPLFVYHVEWSEYTDKLKAALVPFWEEYVKLYNQIANRHDRPEFVSPF